jgi:hypothetical protein
MKKLIKEIIYLMFRSGTSGRYNLRLYKREFRYYGQRLTRGWDDSELWNLDNTISEFVLPRLRRFKEYQSGHPSYMTEEEWSGILNQMILAFENNLVDFPTEEQDQQVEEGLALFAKYYSHLWD